MRKFVLNLAEVIDKTAVVVGSGIETGLKNAATDVSGVGSKRLRTVTKWQWNVGARTGFSDVFSILSIIKSRCSINNCAAQETFDPLCVMNVTV